MTKRTFLYLSLSMVFLLGFLGATLAVQAGPGQSDSYIIVFRDGVEPISVAQALAARSGAELNQVYRHALRGAAMRGSAAQIEKIRKDDRVRFVSEDRLVSVSARNDKPGKPPADNLPPAASTQVLPLGVDRIDAETTVNRGAGVQVAVLDTGIDLSHPDLAANIVGGVNCLGTRKYADDNGHGTHVAGIIAALDNDIGVIGVAPEAGLWSVKVLDRTGTGYWSSIICGLDFVTARAPANGGEIAVANLSLSGVGVSDDNCGLENNDALHLTICRARDAGVTIAAAAGNEALNSVSSVPAAYDDAVITVSALADSDGLPGGLGTATSYGSDDTFAVFSNYGSPVDLGAPGVAVMSTYKGGMYASMSGTSMASPHVAGAAALYLAGNPGAGWHEVLDALLGMAETVGDGHSDPSGMHFEPVLKVNGL